MNKNTPFQKNVAQCDSYEKSARVIFVVVVFRYSHRCINCLIVRYGTVWYPLSTYTPNKDVNLHNIWVILNKLGKAVDMVQNPVHSNVQSLLVMVGHAWICQNVEVNSQRVLIMEHTCWSQVRYRSASKRCVCVVKRGKPGTPEAEYMYTNVRRWQPLWNHEISLMICRIQLKTDTNLLNLASHARLYLFVEILIFHGFRRVVRGRPEWEP